MTRAVFAQWLRQCQRVTIKVSIPQLRAFTIGMLPLCAFATVSDFNEQFKDYTAATMLSLGSLILCGTIAGMLHRLKNEYKVNGTVRHPLLFVSSDLVGGGLAGGLMVLIAFGNNFPSWLVAAATGGSAFAGSMLIEQGWQSLAKRYLPNNPDTPLGQLVEKVKGDTEPPTTPPPHSLGPRGNEGKFD